MARPALIFATWRPPFPLDNGARIRAQRLAAGLAERFDVTLVTFADGPRFDDTQFEWQDLQQVLPGVGLELVSYGRRLPGGARRNAWRRTSVTWAAHATPNLRQALARLVAERPDAVLHLDDPAMGLAGFDLPAAVTAFAPHNIEHRILRESARRRPVSHRVFLDLESRKIAAEERRLWRGSDLCLAVSEIDAASMRAGGARRVEICPNGTDPVEPLPLRTIAPDESLRLLFVGSSDFLPHELGIAWFVREVMPRLRAAGPVSFDVVGAPPLAPVAGEGVVYHGRVPDLRPYYDRAHAVVVPLREGSGTRLKIIEAAAFGRPVISTRLGAEGLPVREGVDYLLAGEAGEFAAAVATLRAALAERPAAIENMTRSARSAIEPLFWPRIVARLADLYGSCLQESPAAAAA